MTFHLGLKGLVRVSQSKRVGLLWRAAFAKGIEGVESREERTCLKNSEELQGLGSLGPQRNTERYGLEQ